MKPKHSYEIRLVGIFSKDLVINNIYPSGFYCYVISDNPHVSKKKKDSID